MRLRCVFFILPFLCFTMCVLSDFSLVILIIMAHTHTHSSSTTPPSPIQLPSNGFDGCDFIVFCRHRHRRQLFSRLLAFASVFPLYSKLRWYKFRFLCLFFSLLVLIDPMLLISNNNDNDNVEKKKKKANKKNVCVWKMMLDAELSMFLLKIRLSVVVLIVVAVKVMEVF